MAGCDACGNEVAEATETCCSRCQDAAAVAALGRQLAGLSWPLERVKVSVLIANRPDLAPLPLIGSRLAAAVAESV